MKNTEYNIQSLLQQISDILLMNGSFLGNPGLYTGEMGLVLFFSHYARYTQDDLYLEYAYGLMEKLQTRIHRETPINYKQGLTGIGSAIEYLVQNNFFEADTDEILEDFDQRIFFTYNLPYLSIDEIMEIVYYALWRLAGNSSKKEMIRQTILPQIEKIIPNNSVYQLRQNTIPSFLARKSYRYCLEFIVKNNFWGNDLGIESGLASWGNSLLTELDGDDSWFALFPNDLNK